jgi:hypothetical protein
MPTKTKPNPGAKRTPRPAPPPKRRPLTSEPGRARFWDKAIYKEATR